MIVKRLLAGLLAIGMIAGAWLIRDRVFDDAARSEASGGSDDGSAQPGSARVMYCASELSAVCRAIDVDDVEIRIATAGTTLDEFATETNLSAMWLTFEPYPAMVDVLRQNAGRQPITYSSEPLASSPLSVVVRNDSSDELVDACGSPVDLACLADQPQLSPTFAPIDTATGAIGVTAATSSYGDGAFDLGDVQFIVWGRRLATAGASSLSGGTAVQTIQTRPTFAVAIGAEAELAPSQRAAFGVLRPEPATTLQVVLMVPDSTDAPDELETSLTTELVANQWLPPVADPDGPLDPGVVLAVADIWEDLQ